jgi:hypothetical protein
MVPVEYRTINRAICLLPDEYQDDREDARAALHALFRQQLRFERKLRERGVATR